MTEKSLFPFCIGLSVFLQIFLLPVLGAIADYTNLKKRLMALFCYAGSAATCLLFFVTGNRYRRGRHPAGRRESVFRRLAGALQRVPQRHHHRGSPRCGLEPRLRAGVSRRRCPAAAESRAAAIRARRSASTAGWRCDCRSDRPASGGPDFRSSRSSGCARARPRVLPAGGSVLKAAGLELAVRRSARSDVCRRRRAICWPTCCSTTASRRSSRWRRCSCRRSCSSREVCPRTSRSSSVWS